METILLITFAKNRQFCRTAVATSGCFSVQERIEKMRACVAVLGLALVSCLPAGQQQKGEASLAADSLLALAEQGDVQAQLRRGMDCDKAGRYDEAARWYRQAAEQGDARAQNNLGVLYKDGQGVGQDYAEAARWFALSAGQGNTLAQSNLGWLYQNGLGVEQDFAVAERLYRLAAAKGHAAAQNNLGTMFLHGMGLPCDTDSACYWFDLAAQQGLPVARQNVARLRNKE